MRWVEYIFRMHKYINIKRANGTYIQMASNHAYIHTQCHFHLYSHDLKTWAATAPSTTRDLKDSWIAIHSLSSFSYSFSHHRLSVGHLHISSWDGREVESEFTAPISSGGTSWSNTMAALCRMSPIGAFISQRSGRRLPVPLPEVLSTYRAALEFVL